MTTYLPRSAWTTAPAGGSPMPTNPRGVAVHWPGSTQPLGNPPQATVALRLAGYRRHHVDTNGWADIAYQVGFDQAGRVWDLRGIDRQSAANGDQTQNRAWGAVLFLLGPGESPSPELLAAFNDWRAGRWLVRYPGATRVVRHGDVRAEPTACPGPIVGALITTGRILTAATTTEDDMQPDERAALFAIKDQLTRPYLPGIITGPAGESLDMNGAVGWGAFYARQAAGLQAAVDKLADAVAAGRDDLTADELREAVSQGIQDAGAALRAAESKGV